MSTTAAVPTITPRELFERHQGGRPVELLDVRTPAEFRQVHATIATLTPLETFDAGAVLASRVGREGEPLYVICQSGGRSKSACRTLADAGCAGVVNVEGGTNAWEKAGLPVVRGEKAVSLERQVRIAAGSLVFLGTALGAFVHPGFLVIPGFVGAGLVFSGVTDTCGMGMALARMPWNRA